MPFHREDIQIIPSPGLHPQADILVYFPKSEVLCTGDLLLSQNCPAVQDVPGYMDFLDKILDIFPPGVTFAGGHGKDPTMDGLYAAFQKAMAGKPRSVRSDGFTPEQRFFISYAQQWRRIMRPEYLRLLVQTDTHAPAHYRVNGPLSSVATDTTRLFPAVFAPPR